MYIRTLSMHVLASVYSHEHTYGCKYICVHAYVYIQVYIRTHVHLYPSSAKDQRKNCAHISTSSRSVKCAGNQYRSPDRAHC